MRTSVASALANWPAVAKMAEHLRTKLVSEDDPDKASEVWSRLVFDPRMKRVWGEVYKLKRIHGKATQEFRHPACVRNRSIAARIRRNVAEMRKQRGPTNARWLESLEEEAARLEKKRTLL